MVVLIFSILFSFTSAVEYGVNIEHDFEVDAACVFASTQPLTNQLNGVTFNGKMAILNQCGNFGFTARSGDEFIAFNTNTYATGPFEATFDQCCTGGVELYVADNNANSWTVQGFDENDQEVENFVVGNTPWTLAKISSVVKKVKITSTLNTYNAWGIDDMTCFKPSDSCVADDCDDDKLGDACDFNDLNCPSCMKCCGVRNECEYREDYSPAAKSVVYTFDTPKDDTPPSNKYIDNHHSYFNTIAISGFVLFILINNVFICYWCICKDNYQKVYQNINKVEEI